MRLRLMIPVLVGLIAIVAVGTIYLLNQQRHDREKQLSSYYDVRLGDSKEEVGYKLGYPSSVQGPYRPDPNHEGWQLSDDLKVNKNGDLEGAPDDPPGGSALQKFDEWHYDLPPDRITVHFDENRKTASEVTCQSWKTNSASKCRPILGVSVGSSEQQVREKLGPPERENITGIFKEMSYPSLGISLMLTKGEVYLIKKTRPALQ